MVVSARPAETTLVTFLLDRTGSMQSIKDDTIGAFNAYLESLKKDGDRIEFSFLQFDSMSIDKICVNTPIAEVHPLTNETFVPRASTPLIDAAYETITAVAEAVARRDRAPKVVICIQTDGQENSSTEHDWTSLNLLIKEKAGLGWQFNFMGAGIDAYEQGRQMGIPAAATVSYDKTSRRATVEAFAAAAENTRNYSEGRAPTVGFSAAQKAAAGDRFAGPAKAVKATVRKIVNKVTF